MATERKFPWFTIVYRISAHLCTDPAISQVHNCVLQARCTIVHYSLDSRFDSGSACTQRRACERESSSNAARLRARADEAERRSSSVLADSGKNLEHGAALAFPSPGEKAATTIDAADLRRPPLPTSVNFHRGGSVESAHAQRPRLHPSEVPSSFGKYFPRFPKLESDSGLPANFGERSHESFELPVSGEHKHLFRKLLKNGDDEHGLIRGQSGANNKLRATSREACRRLTFTTVASALDSSSHSVLAASRLYSSPPTLKSTSAKADRMRALRSSCRSGSRMTNTRQRAPPLFERRSEPYRE
jgi:hypothetical protein